MNWLQIDKDIISQIRTAKDKETLYKNIKNQYKWNNSQTEAAVDPLYNRWHEEKPKGKRKRK